jgi:hypothetical protein
MMPWNCGGARGAGRDAGGSQTDGRVAVGGEASYDVCAGGGRISTLCGQSHRYSRTSYIRAKQTSECPCLSEYEWRLPNDIS